MKLIQKEQREDKLKNCLDKKILASNRNQQHLSKRKKRKKNQRMNILKIVLQPKNKLLKIKIVEILEIVDLMQDIENGLEMVILDFLASIYLADPKV